MLQTDEHVLTNPAVRMASQGRTVDWFRFWLMDEEDLSPPKPSSMPVGANFANHSCKRAKVASAA